MNQGNEPKSLLWGDSSAKADLAALRRIHSLPPWIGSKRIWRPEESIAQRFAVLLLRREGFLFLLRPGTKQPSQRG